MAAQLLPGHARAALPRARGGADWTLAARFAGTDAAVQADVRRLSAEGDLVWQPLPADRTAAFWGLVARGSLGGPITLRLGVLGDGVDETIDLLAHDLDEGLVSAGAGAGMIRWTGDAPVERLRAVRRAAASREIPMTLERAPWPLAPRPGPLRRLPGGRGPARRPPARQLRSGTLAERGAGGR